WLESNCKIMGQQDFALFLEEHHLEMASPVDEDRLSIGDLASSFAQPLEVLELARDLEIYSQESYRSKNNLSSGETEIRFTAEHVDAGNKPVKIPNFFVIQMALFEGGDRVRIPVRLRYRLKDGRVAWFYDLYRVDKALNEAFTMACMRVKADTTL